MHTYPMSRHAQPKRARRKLNVQPPKDTLRDTLLCSVSSSPSPSTAIKLASKKSSTACHRSAKNNFQADIAMKKTPASTDKISHTMPQPGRQAKTRMQSRSRRYMQQKRRRWNRWSPIKGGAMHLSTFPSSLNAFIRKTRGAANETGHQAAGCSPSEGNVVKSCQAMSRQGSWPAMPWRDLRASVQRQKKWL